MVRVLAEEGLELGAGLGIPALTTVRFGEEEKRFGCPRVRWVPGEELAKVFGGTVVAPRDKFRFPLRNDVLSGFGGRDGRLLRSNLADSLRWRYRFPFHPVLRRRRN